MAPFLITLRLHQNDTQLFEDWFILIRNWLQEEVHTYSYSIEWDESVNRHIHIFIDGDYRDADKVKRRLTTKEFKVIIGALPNSKSLLQHALDIKKIKELPKKALGYTQKWHCKRREHKGFTDQEIIDAVEYYYTMTKLSKQQEPNKDWIHVTNKNMHALVEDYSSKNELSLQDSGHIKLKMVMDAHTFQLNPKDQARYFKELRIRDKGLNSTQNDQHSCLSEAYGQEKTYDEYMEADIMDLIKHIQSSNNGCTPPSLQNIYFRYQHLFD